jgi:preprotein translocase subunit SecY
MNLPKIALIGVVVAGAAYVGLMLLGFIAKGILGLIPLIVFGFALLLFIGVIVDRMSNKEDNYYEKNVRD